MHNEGVAHSGEYKVSICKAGFAEAKTQKSIGVIIYNVPAQLFNRHFLRRHPVGVPLSEMSFAGGTILLWEHLQQA